MKKLFICICLFAAMIAALSLTSCKKNKTEEEIKTPVTIEIPFVSDFTCDYYTTDGMQIADKTTRFDHDGEVRVKIGFKLSKAAYEAGKREFTIRFLLPLGFTGDIFEANTSDTFDADLSAVYAVDDRNDKDCRFEARIKFNYSSGILSFGYNYDEEEVVTVGNQLLNCAEAFSFTHDEKTDGYVINKDPDYNEWLNSVETITIPETFAGKPVTAIGARTFSGCGSLTDITIPDTVTNIGEHAFKECEKLYSVNIPAAVTEIGPYAFFKCGKLSSVTIPDGITIIEDSTFYGCRSLTEIIIPDGVTSVGSYAFNECSKLAAVTIPDSVTAIGDFAFMCSGLKSVTIPHGVTNIGNSVFHNCGSLTDVTIPDGVTSIGDSAFSGCGFTNITIPDSVITIGSGAFGHSKLKKITIPDRVTIINDHVFAGCNSLTEVTISFGVTEIGKYSFYGCTSLSSITIPSGVTTINYNAFDSCTGLTSVAIPNSVTKICGDAFGGCTGLTDVYITDLSAWCKINFENALEMIVGSCNPLYWGGNLYLNGTRITNLTIPDDVTSIGAYAFACYRSLTSVTIPDAVNNICDYAFYCCRNLKTITVAAEVKPEGKNAFYNCSVERATAPIAVVSELDKTKLKTVVITGGETIGRSEFSRAYNLTSVTIGNSVKTIEEDAFYDLSSLTIVTIGENVTTIGDRAFYYCKSLTSVTIPDGVTNIGGAAFVGCGNLSFNEYGNARYLGTAKNPYFALIEAANTNINSVDINENTKIIAGFAFDDCERLESVTIPGSVTGMGKGVFYGCKNLKNVKLGSGLTTIGSFYGCTGLESVDIPEGITTIEEETFRDCTKLTSVTIPVSVTVIGKNAFYKSNLWNVNFGGTQEQWLSISTNIGRYSANDKVETRKITVKCTDIKNLQFYLYKNYKA